MDSIVAREVARNILHCVFDYFWYSLSEVYLIAARMKVFTYLLVLLSSTIFSSQSSLNKLSIIPSSIVVPPLYHLPCSLNLYNRDVFALKQHPRLKQQLTNRDLQKTQSRYLYKASSGPHCMEQTAAAGLI